MSLAASSCDKSHLHAEGARSFSVIDNAVLGPCLCIVIDIRVEFPLLAMLRVVTKFLWNKLVLIQSRTDQAMQKVVDNATHA